MYPNVNELMTSISTLLIEKSIQACCNKATGISEPQ